jgi:DNA-binding NarL/FixJ family response regulator/signal transduction histidine kinase
MSNKAAADVPPDIDRATRFLTGLQELLKTPALSALPSAIATSARTCAQCDNAAVFLESGASYRCVVVSDRAGVHSVDDGPVLPEQWPPLHSLRAGLPYYLIPDTRNEPTWSGQAPGSPGVDQAQTWLALALQVGDRLLGFIGLSFYQTTAISDANRRSLEQFASASASLLQQANLLVENSTAARRSALRLELTAELDEAANAEDIAQIAVEGARRNLDASFVGLYPVNPVETLERVVLAESTFNASDPTVGAAIQSLIITATEQKRTLAAPDIPADPCPDEAVRIYRETFLAGGIKALIVTPVSYRGVISAIMVVIGTTATWSAGEVVLAERLAVDTGRALARAGAANDAGVRTAQLDSAARGLWAALDVVRETLTDGSDLRTAVGAIGKAVPAVLPNDALLIVTMPDGSRPLDHLYSDYPEGDNALDDVASTLAPLLPGRTAPWVLSSFDPAESPAAKEALRAAGLQASLAVPVLGEDGDGVVLLLARRRCLFSESETALAERFATVLGAALRREGIIRESKAAAVRDERDRLAREIHDVLAQTITGLVMQLDALAGAVQPDSPLFDRLEQTRNMGRAAAAETRRLVWNLRPASVDLSKPRVVVQEEAGRFGRRASLTPQVDVVGEDRPISSEIGAVIQRLMQVALENVSRHSEATQVHILLHFGLHGLSLQIEDDGEGFDPDVINKSSGRLGLASVSERARQVGGSLRIESAAGHGTRVQLELPFSPAPPVPRARVSESQPAQEPPESPAAPGSIRIVLIDDHAMVREGLTRMLSEQTDFRVLEAVSTGTDGLRAIADLRPDVVLCDLQLPDIPGTEVIARARAHFPDIRCLVVTTFDDDENIYEAIKAGAKGYVLKDASAEDLVDAVRAVARNESLLQPVVAHKLVQRLGALARQGDMVETLTEREIEVLRALAGGLRNKEIAFQLGLSESTIKTHLASIFGKLGVTTRTEAVSRGRELGLVPL